MVGSAAACDRCGYRVAAGVGRCPMCGARIAAPARLPPPAAPAGTVGPSGAADAGGRGAAEEIAPRRSRWSVASTIAFLALALSFALPFAVVVPACSEAETTPLTGIDLVRGAEPDFSTRGTAGERAQAREIASDMQLPAVVALSAAVVGSVVGLLVVGIGVDGPGPLHVLVGCSLLAASAVPAIWLVTWDSDGRMLDGYALAVLGAITASVLSVLTARALWPPGARDTSRRSGRRALLGAVGAWVLFPLAWAADYLSADLASATIVAGVVALGTAAVYAVGCMLLGRPRWAHLIAFALTGWAFSVVLALPALTAD